MVCLSEVVGASVQNNGAADDAARSEQRNNVVRERCRHHPVGISDDIPQISDVTDGVLTSAMVDFVGIVMPASAPAIIKFDVISQLLSNQFAGINYVPCYKRLSLLTSIHRISHP